MGGPTYDFGRDIVTLDEGCDAFLVDTNVVVAYLYEDHPKHKSCYYFLAYLLANEVLICLSEMVASEVIHVLARFYYADETLTENFGHLPLTDSERERKRRDLLASWTSVCKRNDNVLSKYNQLAIDSFRPFFEQAVFIDSTKAQALEAMNHAVVTPLNSADSFIISAAKSVPVQGLLSLDRDMERVEGLDIYSTHVTNDRYDEERMIVNLGLAEIMEELNQELAKPL